METLHIYGQGAWHDDAEIVGDKEALTKLRDAIDKALKYEGSTAGFTAFVNDGEGYNVIVHCEDEKTLESLEVPYSDEIARAK